MQSLTLIFIALGGALGALARYSLALLGQAWGWSGLPWATLLANTLGCFLMGLIAMPVTAALLAGPDHAAWATAVRAFVMVGFLGAFTTYSSFSLEVWRLFEAPHASGGFAGAGLTALGYAGGTLIMAVVACGLGLWLGAIIMQVRAA